MAHLGFTTNEYGTRVSMHRCDTCGSEFTVCGAKEPDDPGWENCLGVDCDSYDVERDVDLMFEVEPHRVKSREPWQDSDAGGG